MGNNTIKIEGEQTAAEIKTTAVDETCVNQVRTLADSDAFENDIKIMPDAHAGSGAVIGFTMPLGDRVCPNTVGVDIGCGMTAMFFPAAQLDAGLESVDETIRDTIPLGFNVYGDDNQPEQTFDLAADFPWHRCRGALAEYDPDAEVQYGAAYAQEVCERVGADYNRVERSLGTLGGGNHFIELATGRRDGERSCIVHSGSRSVGLKIAEYWQDRATEYIDTETVWQNAPDELLGYMDADGMPDYEAIKRDHNGEAIAEVGDRIKALHPDGDRNTDLDYLEGDLIDGYVRDMVFAQTYAYVNRKRMLTRIADALDVIPAPFINSTHNYIDFEDMVIRKGATRAHDGELGIVPFNMADGSILIRGKGNGDWNQSAPHGAGRRGSRRWAHETFDMDEFTDRMDGVFSTSVSEDTLDEAPMAYKDAAMIQSRIQETADIVAHLKPLLNIKAE